MSSKLIRREQCPECRKEGHDKQGDNLAVYDDGHSWCYRCGHFTGEKSEGPEFTYEFLARRGITAATHRFFDVKTKIDVAGKPVSVGYRWPTGWTKVRRLDRKEFYSEPAGGQQPGLFARDKFAAGSHKCVIITEGEDDALSCWQTLHVPSVSVRSSSTAVADCVADRDYINSFERVCLGFDNDSAGREALRGVARLFDYNHTFVLNYDTRKDANDFLQRGEDDELRNVWHNVKRYLPETIRSSFSDFEKILSERPREGVPYPFPTLTDMTYGMRTGESVLITALEGVGKTELMHAIEYQLLQRTDDNVGAIFLEEPKARHLQAISGLHLRAPVHLPDSGVSQTQIVDALKAAIKNDDRLHVYSHFGSDDPDVLLDAARFMASARNCRWLLFDHIGMAVSGAASEDERKKLDYLSTRLEMMVKELDIGLILVSHVNDEGLTRGSRYISKIADLRIDIKRDVLNVDPIERNTTYLTISKNRFSGKTGPAGKLLFDPSTFTFREILDVQAPTTLETLSLRAANDNLIVVPNQVAA